MIMIKECRWIALAAVCLFAGTSALAIKPVPDSSVFDEVTVGDVLEIVVDETEVEAGPATPPRVDDRQIQAQEVRLRTWQWLFLRRWLFWRI